MTIFCPAVFSQDAALNTVAPAQRSIARTLVNQAADASVIQGVNPAEYVKTCNLANPEALLNIIANASEVTGIVWGFFLLLKLLKPMTAAERRKKFAIALLPIAGGLAMPSIINLAISVGRDANLFR
ncbi:unnamed protein product [Sphagnum balticum]